jgi:7-cyano-7-deazaguanine reductase
VKEYIIGYRNLGIFYENAINRIFDDIVKSANPKKIKVIGEFNPRGGITSKVEASYENP